MAGLYAIQDDKLLEFVETPYADEAIFQKMLEDFPALLAGDLIDPASPRKWLLIKREAGIPDAADSGNRWSVDHLFVDQDGIPTLVEVKRSTDTRVRREVVGQMLDYAANSIVYWSVESIREQFNVTHASKAPATGEQNPVLSKFLADAGVDEETLWSNVKKNLQAGRIRMLFVADKIPKELRRIVEFLNVQMDPAEVLALEIKQFIAEGLTTLVPTLIGQTAEAEIRKGSSNTSRQWDEQAFLTQTGERQASAQLLPRVQQILTWSKKQGAVAWGKSGIHASFALMVPVAARTMKVLAVYDDGRVEFNLQPLSKLSGTNPEKWIREIAASIKKFFSTPVGESDVVKYPNVQLTKLADPEFAEFFDALGSIVDQVKALPQIGNV